MIFFTIRIIQELSVCSHKLCHAEVGTSSCWPKQTSSSRFTGSRVWFNQLLNTVGVNPTLYYRSKHVNISQEAWSSTSLSSILSFSFFFFSFWGDYPLSLRQRRILKLSQTLTALELVGPTHTHTLERGSEMILGFHQFPTSYVGFCCECVEKKNLRLDSWEGSGQENYMSPIRFGLITPRFNNLEHQMICFPNQFD